VTCDNEKLVSVKESGNKITSQSQIHLSLPLKKFQENSSTTFRVIFLTEGKIAGRWWRWQQRKVLTHSLPAAHICC